MTMSRYGLGLGPVPVSSAEGLGKASSPVSAAPSSEMNFASANPFSINRFLPGAASAADQKSNDLLSAASYADYSSAVASASSAAALAAASAAGFHPHEHMYYPPPLYHAHHGHTHPATSV
jgi:hypothetical protein